MTQADFTIANQTFPNTRTELNTSLQALATNSAGNSAPSTTFPSQWFFDSDGDTLFIRNKDNDAFVTVLSIGATSDDVQSLFANVIAEGTSATGVTVDGVLLKDGGFTATLGSTITTADQTDTLTLINTDADANVGPRLRLYRNSANPADEDLAGDIRFETKNNAGQDVVAAQIRTQIGDVRDGLEFGEMNFSAMVNGTLTEFIALSSNITPAIVFNEQSSNINFRVESNNNANMLFVDGGNDKVYIGRDTSDGVANVKLQVESLDSSSGISVHRASADTGGPALYLSSSRGASLGDDTVVQDGDDLGSIAWFGADGTDRNSAAASISGQVDGTPGSNDMPGRIVFKTTTDGGVSQTERMRIKNNGDIEFGSFTTDGSGTGVSFEVGGASAPEIYSSAQGTALRVHYEFYNNNGAVGKITTSGSSTTFNTSSDYRLKENVITDYDATTRLKQLKPSRFNFKGDADTTVDGFLAHEVSSIVPEAISGEKDATETKTNVVVNAKGQVIAKEITEAQWTAGKVEDENGNTQYPTDSTWETSKVVPVYQGIDQSKLVPLLVKTIQELEARITSLES